MRVSFDVKQEQIDFFNKIIAKISIKEAADLCGFCERTIRDWRRAKSTVDLDAINALSAKTGVSLPEKIKIKTDYWYTFFGAHKGAMASLKKYGRVGGDAEYHKKKWREWWEKEGKYKNLNKGIFARKSFNKPSFSDELAEFTGILLGDGGISTNQVIISFNIKDENGYLNFVRNLVEKLFNVPFGIYKEEKNSVIYLIISRIGLVEFLVNEIGLKKGDKVKQQVDIPNWIKGNEKYLLSCIRGLIDTDGCIFTHSYKSHGKIYHYKKIAFSNRSKPLIHSVYQFLLSLNFSPRITNDYKDVRLESKSDIERYFNIVGFHNNRYLNKYFS